MYRFVAVRWNSEDEAAAQAARSIAAQIGVRTRGGAWQTAFESEGLRVVHSGARPGRMQACLLDDGRGVVLGRLFRTSPSEAHEPQDGGLGPADSARCIETRGKHLIERFWGRYVAFLYDTASRRHHVVRDPSGAFPCYFTAHDGVDLFFSDVGDVSGLPFLRFSINYDYLATSALLPSFQKRMTGLNEVGEVLPGQSIGFDSARRTGTFLWNPFLVSGREPILDRKDAAARLSDTVQGAVTALAGGYDRILHNLGGLDSSIVLSCLAQVEPRRDLACVNFATPSPRGDERFYARQAADHSGVPLIEAALDPGRVDLARMFDGNLAVSPMGMFDCTAPAGDLYGIAERLGAEALFYGVGGDNVFFQYPYILSALDYARIGRGSAKLLDVIVEACRYGHKSLAYTLRAMLRERIRPEPCFDYVYRRLAPTTSWPLLNPDLVAAGPRLDALHPMLAPPSDMVKGKYFHILTSALLSPEYYDQWPVRYPIERIHPLMSQPVVELCLRIPTWVMVQEGVDRGLARAAFRDMLPAAVARRTSKSSPDELYESVYRANLPLIRERLLDGQLVRQGIVMPAALERMLAGSDVREEVTSAVALEFVSWEMWIEKWASRAPVHA